MELGRWSVARVSRGVHRRLETRLLDAKDYLRDVALGIDTFVPMPESAPDPLEAHARYQPMSYVGLDRLADRLGLKTEDVLYDIGAGKGRVVCYFADRVARCVGVELSTDLAEAAQKNALKIRRKFSNIEIKNIDATRYDYRDGNVYILFNPFSGPILEQFLFQLNQSLVRHPRPLSLVYANPVWKTVVDASGFLDQSDAFSVPFGRANIDVVVWRARTLGAGAVEAHASELC